MLATHGNIPTETAERIVSGIIAGPDPNLMEQANPESVSDGYRLTGAGWRVAVDRANGVWGPSAGSVPRSPSMSPHIDLYTEVWPHWDGQKEPLYQGWLNGATLEGAESQSKAWPVWQPDDSSTLRHAMTLHDIIRSRAVRRWERFDGHRWVCRLTFSYQGEPHTQTFVLVASEGCSADVMADAILSAPGTATMEVEA